MTNFLSFDGQTGLVTVSGYKGIAGRLLTAGTSDRSISCWIRTTVTGSFQSVCWWGDDLTENEVKKGEQCRVRMVESRAELFANGSARRTATVINDGQWHHVVFTYEGFPREPLAKVRNFADALVYVNGVLDNGRYLDDGLTNVNTPAEQDVLIGAQPTSSGIGFTNYFTGDIDEFAIYREVLSSGTVFDIYNSGVRGVDLTTLGQSHALEIWLTMGDDVDDTAPGIIIDQVGFRNGIATPGTSIGS